MPPRTLPGLGLQAFFDLGEDGWNDEFDTNIQTLSALVNGSAKSRSSVLPGTPVLGDIYIVRSDDVTNPNKVAIWDGPSGSEAWVYLTPKEGWTLRVIDESKSYQYDGSGWVLLDAAPGYDFGMFFPGKPTDGQEVMRFKAVRAFTIPDGAPGSTGDARVASTGNVAFSVKRNGTQFATVTFNVSTTGTWAFDAAADEVFAVNDVFSITAPATADATLEDIGLMVKGDKG